jgi:hypothetical protein
MLSGNYLRDQGIAWRQQVKSPYSPSTNHSDDLTLISVVS